MYKRKHQYLSFTQTRNHKKDTKVSDGEKNESQNTMTMIQQEMIHRQNAKCATQQSGFLFLGNIGLVI